MEVRNHSRWIRKNQTSLKESLKVQTERLKGNGSLEREETIRFKFSRDGTNIGKHLQDFWVKKGTMCLQVSKQQRQSKRESGR